MALKGPFNYKGIDLPETYARIININTKHKETAQFQVLFYVDQNLANVGIDNAHYILETRFFDAPAYDYSKPIQEALYDHLKTLPLFAGWENC